jgi:CBS domain-containing protein
MSKTYEVMTYAIASCAPDATVAQVAGIMRDRDIGDVVILENGKLRGIVTDRDLALHALTGKEDPLQMPIKKFMSSKVVTGEAEWSLEQAAEIMAKNQIRRLPILQEGQLVGIVSLGDVARYEDRKNVVTKSLRAVSTPNGTIQPRQSGGAGVLTLFALAAAVTTLIAWLSWNHTGQILRKKMERSDLYHSAQNAVSSAREKVNEVASSKPARDLLQEINLNLNELSARLPTIEYKPPRHQHS